MAGDRDEAVFEALRPLCVKVMSEPSLENLASLQAGVKGLPEATTIPPQLLTYLALPVQAAIKRAGR